MNLYTLLFSIYNIFFFQKALISYKVKYKLPPCYCWKVCWDLRTFCWTIVQFSLPDQKIEVESQACNGQQNCLVASGNTQELFYHASSKCLKCGQLVWMSVDDHKQLMMLAMPSIIRKTLNARVSLHMMGWSLS